LYFPHIGAVSEYFLKGIQTALRPKGYGSNILSGLPFGSSSCVPGQKPIFQPPAASGQSATCDPGIGWCDPDFLETNYFPGEPEKALNASRICNRESGSNPSAYNYKCLTGGSTDYSIGLFQINLLAHEVAGLDCPGAFACYTYKPPACEVYPDKEDILEKCTEFLWKPEENILKMLQVSNNGENWAPWSAASVCGII
jgi:hypothetical protein